MNNNDFLNDFLGGFTGEDGKEYRCVKCKYPMDRIVVKTIQGTPRKIFYCKNKKCANFGIITVVAKT